MKSTLFLVALCSLIAGCFTQTIKQNKDNDLAREYLRGSVKTISQEGVYTKTFNSAGFLVELSTPNSKEVIVLDGNNRIVKINDIAAIVTYDSNNHLTQLGEEAYNDEGMAFFTKYEYNSEGMITKGIFSNGSDMWNVDYLYDNDGHLVKETYIGEVSSERTIEEFNKQGDPIKIVTSEELEMGADPVISETTIKYEYDTNGNWTKKTETTNDKSVTVNRTITYYE